MTRGPTRASCSGSHRSSDRRWTAAPRQSAPPGEGIGRRFGLRPARNWCSCRFAFASKASRPSQETWLLIAPIPRGGRPPSSRKRCVPCERVRSCSSTRGIRAETRRSRPSTRSSWVCLPTATDSSPSTNCPRCENPERGACPSGVCPSVGQVNRRRMDAIVGVAGMTRPAPTGPGIMAVAPLIRAPATPARGRWRLRT